ncbi:MAG: riboflavin synthase [Sutterella parvirubra]|uniref:Riboflavin synthase n=1 Tax=Sutterella parvirubra YIT 11816 TaxID=762967 RepID=H3KGZ6_9BURK|nr:riboflavin synthase [Sutterella parvirubra]EHY30602.1 riboflavin synthase, alpha subunit [Sutterella parvirubra YIT 11816]MCI7709735.1 riboflavin synthase [Sutterella parvirubra]MDR3771567.1 riboflavin synthase [Sutterella sp.]MDY5200873.1 riboflavin synthase [Sutterella parvirubra]
MFTGIIQAVGKVREPEPLGNGVRLTIVAPDLGLEDVKVGDSIAVNGACMTVVEKTDKEFKIDVSAESLSKTTGLDTFGEVNLEKAMRLGDRVDGHLVSGHVDGVGQVESMEQIAESWKLVIRAPRKLSPYLAYKGSITVNGVSLTINSVEDTALDTLVSINLIPHTVEVTTLKNLKAQSYVNLEIDLIARYCERMMSLKDEDSLF